MLEIKNLHANAGDQPILSGMDLKIGAGEVHAVMGPNGSGKSTLSNILAGRPGYTVTSGQVLYEGKDLTRLEPEERAREGIFLAFQYPIEIPGVSNNYFLKASVNAVRSHRGEAELDAMEFLSMCQQKMKAVEMHCQHPLHGRGKCRNKLRAKPPVAPLKRFVCMIKTWAL